MSDDGFHEIQLNGKQLIFLFMAATVVSVVIFLCGVMVGRGVRGGRGDSPIQTSQLDTPAQAASPAAAPVTVPPAPAPSASPKAGASQPTPPESAEDSSVYKDLTSDHPKDTSLAAAAKTTAKPAAAPAAKTPAVVEKPTPKPTPPAPAEAGPPAAVTSGGYAVQLTALRDRSEADAVVKRLAAKGYPAFIVNPLPGKPPVYRVQVGRYQNRAEADRIASKLQKEEQFSPWVTH